MWDGLVAGIIGATAAGLLEWAWNLIEGGSKAKYRLIGDSRRSSEVAAAAGPLPTPLG